MSGGPETGIPIGCFHYKLPKYLTYEITPVIVLQRGNNRKIDLYSKCTESELCTTKCMNIVSYVFAILNKAVTKISTGIYKSLLAPKKE